MAHLPLIDRIIRRIGNAVCWLFLAAAAVSGYEVFMDSAFGAPTIWVHDTTVMLCATAFLVGGAYAMQRREHIRISVVYDMMGPRAQWLCDLLAYLLTLAYLLQLAYFVLDQAAESIAIVERSGRAWDFPMPMVIRTAFAVGVVLLIAQALAQLLRHILARQSR